MKIKKNDTVKMLTGKDRGKTGKVIKVDTKSGKITIEGLNVYKKHVRPRKQGEKGEIVQVTRPVNISNVGLICPGCNKTIRVGYRFQNKNKVRYCRKCGQNL